MRVGLVLGAGGVVGASWLVGALEALEAETGWEAWQAETIVGTSAGAAIGALAASGIPPQYMAGYVAGREVDAIADAAARAGKAAPGLERATAVVREAEAEGERLDGSTYRLARALPPIGPGSWRMALSTLRHPLRHSPAACLCGWLPRGFVSTDPIRELVETFVPDDWPDHPRYRAVAADYGDGRRVAFGAPGAPPARVGEAVAASCAIPAFYHPVSIAGHRYVDGGICSPTNLDLVRGMELDLVVCLSPMSSLAQATGGSPGDRAGALLRVLAGRRLGHEARKLREAGTKVLILQPTAADVRVMGLNFMSGARRVEVTETATRTTAAELRELRAGNALLPGRSRRRLRSTDRPTPVARRAKAAPRKAKRRAA